MTSHSMAVRALVTALETNGLVTRVPVPGAVHVLNPDGEPDPECPAGPVTGAGLRQEVRCERWVDGTLWWFWAWAGMTRQSPPDLEPLCPADEPERAADRIAKVLGARPTADHRG